MLLALKDGGIEHIWSDDTYEPGCPTCDYGSHYINDIVITLTKYKIFAHIDAMYSYKFSAGDMMLILLPAIKQITEMTELDFIEWFRNALSGYADVESASDTALKYEVTELKTLEVKYGSR